MKTSSENTLVENVKLDGEVIGVGEVARQNFDSMYTEIKRYVFYTLDTMNLYWNASDVPMLRIIASNLFFAFLKFL